MNERFIRITHAVLFSLTLLLALITLGIGATLVSKYNKEGYPKHNTKGYRDRIRITLVGGVWTAIWTLVLTIAFQVAGHNAAFGILTHLIPLVIGFLLLIIGVSSLTALTDKISCSNAAQTFAHCSTVKGLVIVGWIDTIFVFLALVFVVGIAFKARAWGGVRRNTLYVD